MPTHRLDHRTAIPAAADREEWNRLLYAESRTDRTTTAPPQTPPMPVLTRTERRKSAASSHAWGPEWPPATPTSALAVISFIFGLGVFVTFGMTGPPAVLLGHFAYAETVTGERDGHGMTVAALFFGYFSITAWIVAIIFLSTIGRDIPFPQFPQIPSATN